MNFSVCQKFFGLLLLVMATLSFACNSRVTQSSEGPKIQAQTEQTQPKATATPFIEPVSPIDAPQYSAALRQTWQRFTANNQYRLAQVSDMRLSDLAKESLAHNIGSGNPIPFVYLWGGLNYNKRPEDGHLAAIVVDTTKTDNNRFGLVIFSPPEGKKDVYETHWFCYDCDLSKTTVNRASGYLYATEYLDNGTQKSCSIA